VTHGDVSPIISLGRALKARVAQFCIVPGVRTGRRRRAHGLDAASPGVDFSEILAPRTASRVESCNGITS